jgi:UDP-glucose 4-epimerase
MSTKRVAVLGGAGFIGSHLCQALAGQGNHVRVFDRSNADLKNLKAMTGSWEFLGGDFMNESDVQEAVADADLVYHLISTTVPATSNENPIYDAESNLLPTLRLLESLRHTKTKKVIFLSSGGTVYGIPQELPLSEDHPTKPTVAYGVVKLTIERYLALYQRLHGLEFSVIRLANPYGPRQDAQGALGAASVFLWRAFENKPIEIWGDGSVVRDYVYVDDAVRGILAAGALSGSGIYNIGSGEGISLKELVAGIQEVIGREVDVQYTPGRRFDVPKNVLNIQLAKDELNWMPQVGLHEGLRRTLAWIESRNG